MIHNANIDSKDIVFQGRKLIYFERQLDGAKCKSKSRRHSSLEGES